MASCCEAMAKGLVAFVFDEILEQLAWVDRRIFNKCLVIEDGRGRKAGKCIYLDHEKLAGLNVCKSVDTRIALDTDFFCHFLDPLAYLLDHCRFHDGRWRRGEIDTGSALEFFLHGEDLALCNRY